MQPNPETNVKRKEKKKEKRKKEKKKDNCVGKSKRSDYGSFNVCVFTKMSS